MSSTDNVVGSNPTDADIIFLTTLLDSWSVWDYTPPLEAKIVSSLGSKLTSGCLATEQLHEMCGTSVCTLPIGSRVFSEEGMPRQRTSTQRPDGASSNPLRRDMCRICWRVRDIMIVFRPSALVSRTIGIIR